jgi:MFS family permease
MEFFSKILPPQVPSHLYFLGVKAFRRGEYFQAHEIWEKIFHQFPPGDIRRVWIQSLIQIAVFAHKAKEGNERGSTLLLLKARNNLSRAIADLSLSSPWIRLLGDLERIAEHPDCTRYVQEAKRLILPGEGRERAFFVIILFGIVSLLADMTYEGAKSVIGPFLEELGATGLLVGIVGGLGELVGYAMRFFSGFFLQRGGSLWGFLFVGYLLNLLTVPALALIKTVKSAVLLHLGERFGKGLRTPARDTLLAHASEEIGSGLGFGVHEALDSVGALLGPILCVMVLYIGGADYRQVFLVLGIPAVFALLLLLILFLLEHRAMRSSSAQGHPFSFQLYPRNYYLLVFGSSLLGAGTLDYPLIGYHIKKNHLLPEEIIPLVYGGVMGGIALLSPFLGKCLDTKRYGILKGFLILGIPSTFLLFSSTPSLVLSGVPLYAISLTFQGGLLSALITRLVAKELRPGGYGIFHSIYGASWFLGSALLGYLYDRSPLFLQWGGTVLSALGVGLMLRSGAISEEPS